MEFMEMVAFLGAVAFCGLVLAAVALALWQGAGNDTPVLLYPMLRRQGQDVARIATASGDRNFALAVKQCLQCRNTARCRAWLDSGGREGFDQFCANAGYVSQLRSLATIGGMPRWT